ncbi:MAG: MCE family protein [Prevotella sp.]|nr:MCE family protein [Prevotella sp.]MBQ8453655.1 MCE family protein [Prevotella sp.]
MKKEIKIALTAIVAIVILFFGMNFLKGLTMFSGNNVYYVAFDDISGLTTSSPIYANGYQVGVVTKIKYDYTHQQPTLAMIDVNPDMRIPRESKALIESDMLGNLKLNLRLGSDLNDLLAPGDTIIGEVNGGALEKLSAMTPAIEKMLPKLDSIMMSVNTLLADPAIAQTLHNAEKITNDLTTSTRQLNALMDNVNKQLPDLMTKANTTLDNAAAVSANLKELDLNATKNQMDQTLANVRALTEQLNAGDGTLGLLLKNPELYQNLSSTMREADSLLNDLRQHPSRYVNISVFGRKSK